MRVLFSLVFTIVLFTINTSAQSCDTLNILIFGHSYGVDCTEHLPKLIDAAGINSVRIARFYKGNCSLQERYKFFQEDWPKGYNECEPGHTEWVERPCTFREAINARKWDYVIFQNSLENEGRYKMAQPYLNDMISYIREVSNEKFGSEPEICWNMFWPISYTLSYTQTKTQSFRMSFYDHNPEKMFQAYMEATKELMKDTGISNIVPSGTAIMNLRASYLNTIEMQDFTRDGYHMSFGAGRYAAACVLFEHFIKPHYGISVLGNSLRLPDYKQPVTDDNADFIQRCAVAAVESPFVINYDIGPRRPEQRMLIGGLRDVMIKDAGKLNYPKDFIIEYEKIEALGLTLKEQLRKTSIVDCKAVIRSIVKELHARKSPDIMGYGDQVVEQTYNSLRHMIAISKFLDKPVRVGGLCSDREQATFCAFRDKDSGITSFIIWDDTKQPDKNELMGCISLIFEELPYSDPICIDIRSGAIYSPIVKNNTIMEFPYYDSPVLLTDKQMISHLIK